MARSYGLGGAGLAGAGLQQKSEAMTVLGRAAEQEADRNMANKQMEQQRQAGNQQLGATGGAMVGMAYGGPIGALIGGVVGALGGNLF